MKLTIGHKIYWHDPDNGTCSGIYTIKGIDDIDHTVILKDEAGSTVWALVAELEDPINALLSKVNELTDYANKLCEAAIAYGEAVDNEMESGDYKLDDFGATDEQIEQHDANVDASCKAWSALKELVEQNKIWLA